MSVEHMAEEKIPFGVLIEKLQELQELMVLDSK